MMRVSSMVRLREETVAEYIRLHTAVWPEVLERIQEANMTNYSIFVGDSWLVVYFEYVGEDYDADMATMAADATVQRWWDLTRPFAIEAPSSADGRWPPLVEVFHLD